MGQSPLGGTCPTVLSSAPQKSGGARFKIPTFKRGSNHPGEHALSGDDDSSAILICDRLSPSQAQQPPTHAMLMTQAMLSPQQAATATVGYMPPHQDCIDMADFLAQDYVTEIRSGLPLTPEGTEHHLRLHNNICGHLVEKLTAILVRTDIPAPERHTLGLLYKISQHNILETWPGERLRRRATTMRVDGLLGELAEFETRRLDFMTATRATLLEVCENLYNPERAATAIHLPQRVHFLDLKQTVTWIQVALPANLTDPRLQRRTLHQTLGLLGGVIKIFLFKPRPEGFIIFDGNPHLPNIDGIRTPQGIWIEIHNPHHPSAPISTASSPHYPTWRPGIGSRVTLIGKHCEVTVIAIEKKHWPAEWVYLIWREDVYRLPTILHSHLYRQDSKAGDNSYRIKPIALQPADGEVAYFFNNFEELTKVTVIGQNRPGFFDTIRLVLTPDDQISREIFQTISCYRLFQLNVTSALDPLHARIRHDLTTLPEFAPQAMSREQTTGPGAVNTDIVPGQDPPEPLTPLDSTPKLNTNWNKNPRPQRSRDQTPNEVGPRAMTTETVPSQKSPNLSALFHLTPVGSSHPHKAPRTKRGRATLESEVAPPPEHDSMVVITKKRRTGRIPIPLILVRWRNFTIPCKYTDRLTPAMLIDAIRLSPLVGQDTLAKSTLTLPNNLSATLHMHVTLCSQGISVGAVVTIMTRYAKVLDPHGSQHYIAYQSEDKIQGFIEAIKYVSPHLLLSELEVCHEGSLLDPNRQVQECDLPQDPSLQVRLRSHPGGQSHQESVLIESAPSTGQVPGGTKTSLPPVTGPQDHRKRTQTLTQGLDDSWSTRSLNPSQTFVQDPRGRTHVVPFQSTDSIATNLLRYSLQLSLPPLEEVYILAGGKPLKIEYTALDNGLHSEPHLTIMIRCRGGMKKGVTSSPRGKGRGGQRASEGSLRGMGGGQTTMEDSRPPLDKIAKGRGRGLRPDSKRPTVLHTQSLDDMDNSSLLGLTMARMEAFHTHTARLCQERCESSYTALDYGPLLWLQTRIDCQKLGPRHPRTSSVRFPQPSRAH